MDKECFEVVYLPPGQSTIPSMWLFKVKPDTSGNLTIPKARMVVGSHRQVLNWDCWEFQNYAAVLNCWDYRLMLVLAAANKWAIAQTNISQAFLEGKLDDAEIYIKPPSGFPCQSGKVLKLRKAVYGLRQAPVKFKDEVVAWFQESSYSPCNASKTIWILRSHHSVIIHTVYVNDFLHFYD